MKTILLKELRENAKWAILIGCALALLLLLDIAKPGPFFIYQLAQRTLFFAPLAGLTLGVAQNLFETRSDRWAFAVHRPISRQSVFFAKSVVGLGLLYAAIAFPVLLAAAWAAQPGNLASPFHWQALLPMAADTFNAGTFYFAGIILTLRKASWFGTRVLPVGLACSSSAAIWLVPDFWQAMLIALVAQVIAAFAAWNAFATGGTCERRGGARFALAVTIFAGALGIGCVLDGVAGLLGGTLTWHDLRLDREGQIIRITRTWDGNEHRRQITDLGGRVLATYQGADAGDPSLGDQFVQFGNTMFDDRSAPSPASIATRGYRNAATQVIRLQAVAKPQLPNGANIGSFRGQVIATPIASGAARVPYICVLDVLDRVIKLYDPLTHSQIGSVGPAGFSTISSPPSERFPESPLNLALQSNSRLLKFPSVVYCMELDERRVRPIFTAAEGDPVISACEPGPPEDPLIAVLTATRLYVLNSSGKEVFSTPVSLDTTRSIVQMTILGTTGNFFLRAEPLSPATLFSTAADSPTQVLEFSPNGKVVRQTLIERMADASSSRTLRQTAIMGAVWPLVLFPLYALGNLDEVFRTGYAECGNLFLASMFASGLLSAVATLFIGRRIGFGIARSLAWSATNLLLGPAGLVAFLGMNDWPAQEPCASCGGKRLVGRRDCLRCGASLPPPMLDGREIFEPEDAFPAVA